MVGLYRQLVTTVSMLYCAFVSAQLTAEETVIHTIFKMLDSENGRTSLWKRLLKSFFNFEMFFIFLPSLAVIFVKYFLVCKKKSRSTLTTN